jgi:hypothetical protein
MSTFLTAWSLGVTIMEDGEWIIILDITAAGWEISDVSR